MFGLNYDNYDDDDHESGEQNKDYKTNEKEQHTTHLNGGIKSGPSTQHSIFNIITLISNICYCVICMHDGIFVTSQQV